MTSLPSASIPAASQPRTIGSRSWQMPTPFSVHRSWWLSEAARTETDTQPAVGTGSGRSPTSRPESGSSGLIDAAVTASIRRTLPASAARYARLR